MSQINLRPMYEYKVIEGRQSLEIRLNLFGSLGWQLVAAEWATEFVDECTFVFMRELQVEASMEERPTPLPELASK